MKKRLYLPYLTLIVMMHVITTSVQASEPAKHPVLEQTDQETKMVAAEVKYKEKKMLQQDLRCLLKRTCTPVQEHRIRQYAAYLPHNLKNDVMDLIFSYENLSSQELEPIECRLRNAGLLE